jgi:hypothetical protein
MKALPKVVDTNLAIRSFLAYGAIEMLKHKAGTLIHVGAWSVTPDPAEMLIGVPLQRQDILTDAEKKAVKAVKDTHEAVLAAAEDKMEKVRTGMVEALRMLEPLASKAFQPGAFSKLWYLLEHHRKTSDRNNLILSALYNRGDTVVYYALDRDTFRGKWNDFLDFGGYHEAALQMLAKLELPASARPTVFKPVTRLAGADYQADDPYVAEMAFLDKVSVDNLLWVLKEAYLPKDPDHPEVQVYSGGKHDRPYIRITEGADNSTAVKLAGAVAFRNLRDWVTTQPARVHNIRHMLLAWDDFTEHLGGDHPPDLSWPAVGLELGTALGDPFATHALWMCRDGSASSIDTMVDHLEDAIQWLTTRKARAEAIASQSAQASAEVGPLVRWKDIIQAVVKHVLDVPERLTVLQLMTPTGPAEWSEHPNVSQALQILGRPFLDDWALMGHNPVYRKAFDREMAAWLKTEVGKS